MAEVKLQEGETLENALRRFKRKGFAEGKSSTKSKRHAFCLKPGQKLRVEPALARKLPFAFHHVVLNADGHAGFGTPIGGVCTTKDVIVPNMVGVDIGCGMLAGRFSRRESDAKHFPANLKID